MSLVREVNQQLERGEDCYEEPATREKTPMTIVEEEFYEDLHVASTTSGYSKVGVKNKRGLLDCLQRTGPKGGTGIKDTDEMLVRAMLSIWSCQGARVP